MKPTSELQYLAANLINNNKITHLMMTALQKKLTENILVIP